jgi:hypothetical protein
VWAPTGPLSERCFKDKTPIKKGGTSAPPFEFYGEAQFFFHGDRGDQLNIKAEAELRTAVGKERRMTATVFLSKNVGLCLELLVWLYGAGPADNLVAQLVRQVRQNSTLLW